MLPLKLLTPVQPETSDANAAYEIAEVTHEANNLSGMFK